MAVVRADAAFCGGDRFVGGAEGGSRGEEEDRGGGKDVLVLFFCFLSVFFPLLLWSAMLCT